MECHVFPRDVPLFLPLSALAHQGLSFGSWIFHAGAFAWSQSCVTSSPGRLNAAWHLNFPVTQLRQNRSKTSVLAGTVSARAILFQRVAPYGLAIGSQRQLQQESVYICYCSAYICWVILCSVKMVLRFGLVWYMNSGTQLFNFAVCADWHMNSCLFFHQSTEFNHSINSLQTPQRSWIVRSILWETHLQVNFRVLC